MIDEEVFKGRAFACRATDARYSCMYCNKWWSINDPKFEYWRAFTTTHWMVRGGIVRAGDPMNVIDVSTDKPLSAGYDPLGWFARCVDKEACDRRRRNLHNGVPAEHLSFLDEAEHVAASLCDAMKVMA